MEDVLVVTLPQRNYDYGSNSTYNDTVSSNLNIQIRLCRGTRFELFLSIFLSNGQINDYVAGYHDGALLFGKVLRERRLSLQRNKGSYDVPLSDNPFGNVSFDGAYDQCQLKVRILQPLSFALFAFMNVTG